MRRQDTSSIWALIIALVIFLFVRACTSTVEYNGGICPRCGGTFVYQQAVGHRYSTNYIYKCDKCGKTIEIGNNYEGVNYEIDSGDGTETDNSGAAAVCP